MQVDRASRSLDFVMSRTNKTRTQPPVKTPEELEFERLSREMCEKGEAAADALYENLVTLAERIAPAFGAKVETSLHSSVYVSFGAHPGVMAPVRLTLDVLSARLCAMRDGDFLPRLKHEIACYSVSGTPSTVAAQAERMLAAVGFARAIRAAVAERVVFASDL